MSTDYSTFRILNQIRKLLRKNSRQKRSRYNSKYIKLPDTQKFYDWKIRISNDQNETILAQYLDFLKIYPGSKIIRKDGKKTLTYSGPELGILKGIFFHVIVPSRRLSTASKEEFRSFLLKLGVEGVNERPNYEERNGKLKIRKGLSEEDSRIKSVGNIGEQLVRDTLSLLPPQYKGVRTKRGLFISSTGKAVNADLNGSLNILRKFLQNTQVADEFHVIREIIDRGLILRPHRISLS